MHLNCVRSCSEREGNLQVCNAVQCSLVDAQSLAKWESNAKLIPNCNALGLERSPNITASQSQALQAVHCNSTGTHSRRAVAQSGTTGCAVHCIGLVLRQDSLSMRDILSHIFSNSTTKRYLVFIVFETKKYLSSHQFFN